MNQETYERLKPIEFNYDQDWVPKKVKKLKPKVFRDGEFYCCLFGPDQQVGIYGRGASPQEAILAWEKDLNQRIEALTERDDAAHHAVKHLGQH